MAVAMGRTLVLPPEQRMYLLTKNDKEGQRWKFSFNHFFHLERIANEHVDLDILTMQEFLEREAMRGNLINKQTGAPTFPPGNRTNWYV